MHPKNKTTATHRAAVRQGAMPHMTSLFEAEE